MRTDIISGILQRLNLSAFMISSVFKTTDTGQIFRHLSQNRINVEFINQVPLKNGRSDIILCVDSSNRYSVSTELEKLKSLIHARNIVQIQNVGLLSIFPHKEHAFVISSIIQSLTAEDIPVLAMGKD